MVSGSPPRHPVIDGFKKCNHCGSIKLETDYYIGWRKKDGSPSRHGHCKSCDKIKRAAVGYKKPTKPKSRGWWLRAKYGLTHDRYQEMVSEQDSKCKICGTYTPNIPGKRQSLCVDHNHTTGKVRALLCGKCNTTLGLIETSRVPLEKYFQYIEEYSKSHL